MAKPWHIELADGTVVPILYEDRAAMAVDKPAGWMLAPDEWVHTSRNLHLALQSSLRAGDHWARSRNLDFVRFVHRLDADTSGILLLAKSMGSLKALSDLFQSHRIEKTYLAVVVGIPKESEWTCDLPLGPQPDREDAMRVDRRQGKPATTHFRVLASRANLTVVEGRPVTGRTHQIRVHLAESGYPIVNDRLYGVGRVSETGRSEPLALRSVGLAYVDPFRKRRIVITAPSDAFLRVHGFSDNALPPPQSKPRR